MHERRDHLGVATDDGDAAGLGHERAQIPGEIAPGTTLEDDAGGVRRAFDLTPFEASTQRDPMRVGILRYIADESLGGRTSAGPDQELEVAIRNLRPHALDGVGRHVGLVVSDRLALEVERLRGADEPRAGLRERAAALIGRMRAHQGDSLRRLSVLDGVPENDNSEQRSRGRDDRQSADRPGLAPRDVLATQASERCPARHRHGRQRRLGDDLDHLHRVLQALESLGPALLEADALDPAGERDDGLAREDLPWRGARAEPRREVQGAAAVAAFDGNGLAGVEPDPDPERKRRLAVSALAEEPLQVDRRAQGLPRRREDAERLVAAELEELSSVRLDPASCERREGRGELRGGLVAVLLRETRVAADVGDQERAQGGADWCLVRHGPGRYRRPGRGGTRFRPARAARPRGAP